MKTGIYKNDNFKFKDFFKREARCGVEIVEVDGKIYAILAEQPDNHGVSVTNAVEIIATAVYNQFLSDKPINKIVWVEHYIEPKETFDEVTLFYNGVVFQQPQWKSIEKPGWL